MKAFYLGLTAVVLLLCAGCMVGPDYFKPSAPMTAAYKEDQGWKLARPSDTIPRGKWWEIFGDPQLNALEEQVPGYANANAVSAALAKRAEAVKSGTQYLGNGKTTPSPERFAADFDPLSQGEKIALAKGSRGEVERILGTKANDLQALRGELQGEGGWNTAKLATVHGQPAADELVQRFADHVLHNDEDALVVGLRVEDRDETRMAERCAQSRLAPQPPRDVLRTVRVHALDRYLAAQALVLA